MTGGALPVDVWALDGGGEDAAVVPYEPAARLTTWPQGLFLADADTGADRDTPRAPMPARIYCSAGGWRWMSIALCHGFLPGAQLPGHVATRQRLFFADQNWKAPNRPAYMAALARHRPVMASVLDWEREEQWGEVLDWAEEAAGYVDAVMIIPKVPNTVDRIPDTVDGKPVVLGYSVGNKYGGTPVPLWELAGRRVHLLGGQPQQQMRLWRYLHGNAEVVSCDGNQLRQGANRGQVWVPGNGPRRASNRFWPTLNDLGMPQLDRDAHLLAFHWSCINVQNAWTRLAAEMAGPVFSKEQCHARNPRGSTRHDAG